MEYLPALNYTLLVPLNPQQLEARRILLNQAGQLAWLSPAILFLPIASYILLTPSKPTSRDPPSTLQLTQRRISWLLNTPLSQEFGSLSTHLIGLAYFSWLLFLVFRGTGDDYMHLTKAFGHVAISQLPMQYLLALKSPWNPLQFLLQQSHEELNDVHRLFGRIVHVLLTLHALLYLNFFVRVDVLDKKIKDPTVRLGIAAFWCLNFVTVLSIPPLRRRFYHKIFYRSHVVLTAVVLPLLYFHVPYTRIYVLQAGALYLFNGFTRALASSPAVSVRVEKIQGTSLLRLKVDGSASERLGAWTPGMHVYIKQSNSPVNPKTPFTVVAWPGSRSEKVSIDLVVKDLAGPQTGWLAKQEKVNLLLEGPYGESKNYLPAIFKCRNEEDAILLVAGGVGVTYTLPIYLALLGKYQSSANITFIWYVKSIAEVAWAVEMMGSTRCDVNVSIYITGDESGKFTTTDLGGVKKGISVYSPQEREHIANIADGIFEHDGRVYVFACGPSSMARALRTEVGFHVMRNGRDVVYHEEQFGLGSS